MTLENVEDPFSDLVILFFLLKMLKSTLIM